MNPDLDKLQPYPFERLNRLKSGIACASKPHIALSMGEPAHAPPEFVVQQLIDNLHGLSRYPVTRGSRELREAIVQWLQHRFRLPGQSLDPDQQVLPVNGTREALFAFAQALIDPNQRPLVIMPNPFYQIYEGAALLAGAEPLFLNSLPENGYLPDIDSVPAKVWERCQLIYLCSPGNPTGAVADISTLQRLIALAEQHDFTIASDECYSELYYDEQHPPVGLLQAAAEMGNTDYRRCVVFHSLSKRSNLPGLRSGFVAGDRSLIDRFLLYRTYHGSAMPPATQAASIAAWQDEQHVIANRLLYRQKYDAVLPILAPLLEVSLPPAGFYLWPRTPNESDTEFAQSLYRQQNVTLLPGSFLSRRVDGVDPGAGRVRIALVAEQETCVEAAQRIAEFIGG